jgi:hypothetical protein
MTIASILQYAPPRLRQFFTGGPEMTIASALSATELAVRFRSTLQDSLNFPTGATGKVRGSRIYVRWGIGMMADGFAPAFYGRIDPTETGSRLIGRVSGDRFGQIFLGFWCGAIVLFAIVFVWTIFIPLGCYALLWTAEGLMWFGDTLHPDRTQKITNYLRQTCDQAAR